MISWEVVVIDRKAFGHYVFPLCASIEHEREADCG